MEVLDCETRHQQPKHPQVSFTLQVDESLPVVFGGLSWSLWWALLSFLPPEFLSELVPGEYHASHLCLGEIEHDTVFPGLCYYFSWKIPDAPSLDTTSFHPQAPSKWGAPPSVTLEPHGTWIPCQRLSSHSSWSLNTHFCIDPKPEEKQGAIAVIWLENTWTWGQSFSLCLYWVAAMTDQEEGPLQCWGEDFRTLLLGSQLVSAISDVTLSQLLDLTEHQFVHLWNGENMSSNLPTNRAWWIHAKYLVQCQITH